MRKQSQRFHTSRSFRKEDSYLNTTFRSNNSKNQIMDPQQDQFNKTKQKHQIQQSFVTLVDTLSIPIQNQIQQLIQQSSSYSKAQLYGYSIEKLKTQLSQQKKTGLAYVWACYNSFNWESVSLANLIQYVSTFPTQERIIQDIRIQNNQIKLDKMNKTLSYSLLDKQFKLQDKSYTLNRFANRIYQKSLTKMTFDIQAYQFNGIIRQIQSNQFLVGIRTDKSLYLISPVNQIKRFDIRCRDIKINQSRLFFIDQNGHVGSILLQNVYVPKMNQIEMEQLSFVDYKCDEEQFLISAQKCMIIARLIVSQYEVKIAFKTFLRKQSNFEFPLNIDLEQDEKVIYRNAVYAGKYLHLIILTGWQGKINKFHQIKFLVI